MLRNLVDLFTYFTLGLRAGTLVFQSVLLGGVVFVLWVARPSAEASQESIDRVQACSSRLLQIIAIGLVTVQLLYLYVNSAVLMVTADIGLRGIIGANFFISGSIVATTALFTAIAARCKRSRWVLLGLIVVMMGASLMTNHAASRIDGRPLLVLLSCMHELSAGFWIGGLPFLVLGLLRAMDVTTQWYVTERFSRMALIGVGTLFISGLVMSVLYVRSWHAVLGTSYGVMVVAKALMLGVLLLLGGANFLLIRNTSKESALPRLRRLIEAEVGIGITVILTAASLTSQPPAVDQLSETVTLQQIYQRFKPTLPRFRYQTVPLSADVIGPAAAAMDRTGRAQPYNLDGASLTTELLNEAIRSESNHHWMGTVVLAMGFMALLARTGRAPWTECWPLLLIAIAIFVFLGDWECWPVGSRGFWTCWADPEVFQHRIAGLACAAFALMELRVRRRREENDSSAMVFPLICALGGALLLTHSHDITFVKENLLLELSHVPMGVLAVFAGWARWLELRLPEKDRAIPSWIWPACFVLIGAVLLDYREM